MSADKLDEIAEKLLKSLGLVFDPHEAADKAHIRAALAEAVAAERERRERAEAALRSLADEAPCSCPGDKHDPQFFANCFRGKLIRAALSDPAEGFFARGEDGQYHPDPAPEQP